MLIRLVTFCSLLAFLPQPSRADSWWDAVTPRPSLNQEDEKAVDQLLDEAETARPHRGGSSRSRRGSGWDMNDASVQAGIVPTPKIRKQKTQPDQPYEKEILDLIPSEPAPETYIQAPPESVPSARKTTPLPSDESPTGETQAIDPKRAAIERALDADRAERGVAPATAPTTTRRPAAVTPESSLESSNEDGMGGTIKREIVTLTGKQGKPKEVPLYGNEPLDRLNGEDGTAARFEGNRDSYEDDEDYEPRVDKKKKRRSKKRVKRRRRAGRDSELYASVDPEIASDGESRTRTRTGRDQKTLLGFRVGLQGGVSMSTPGNGYVVTSGAVVGGGSNAPAFAATGEYRSRYLGVEVEGSYANRAGSGADLYSAFGVMASVNGRAELPMGQTMRLIPKLGVGFAYLHSETNPMGDASAAGGRTSAQGLYGIAGFEWKVSETFGLHFDYAMSLGSSNMTLTSVAPGGATTENRLTSSKFDRFRAGATYYLSPQFGLGAQVVLRTLVHGEPSGGMDAQNQFMGTISYDF